MTEQDDIIMNQLYRFCHTGEGREGMANVLSHIFQREGGSCQGLHRFLFENEALPEIGAHLVAQLSLTDNHFFVGFMQQFAKELQFDNIHDYFDAQQMTADRKLTYAFMLGLGTENDRGIFQKIHNALRFIPKPSTSPPNPNANNSNDFYANRFSTPPVKNGGVSAFGTHAHGFGTTSLAYSTPLRNGLFSARKENSVNGTTPSFLGNSQVSLGDMSSVTFGGLSISGSGNPSAVQKKGERGLLYNMNLIDVQHKMLNKHGCQKLIKEGLVSQDALCALQIEVFHGQTSKAFNKFKTECEDEEGIYDEEERNADKRIAEMDGQLGMSKSQEQELMRTIQEDEEEEMRQLKAKHDERRRLVKHQHAAIARGIEEEKERCQSEKVRIKEEKEKNLTRPLANLRTIQTVNELVPLYHRMHVLKDQDPDLQGKIATSTRMLELLLEGIASNSFDDLKNLVWDDDDL